MNGSKSLRMVNTTRCAVPASVTKATTRARNSARRASSVQRVNVSSNWSMSRSSGALVPLAAAKARSNATPGSEPGTIGGRICQPALPGMPSARKAGSKPAHTRDDLPLPEGPTTAIRRWSRSRSTSSATTRRRPKKSADFASSKASSPRYGQAASGNAGDRSGSKSARVASGAGSPARSSTVPQ